MRVAIRARGLSHAPHNRPARQRARDFDVPGVDERPLAAQIEIARSGLGAGHDRIGLRAIGVVVVSAGAGSVSAGAGVVTVGVLLTSTVEVDGCEFAEKTRYAMASSAKATMMPTNQPVELFSRV